ncbi:Rha family transcriptional regulator [Clostridium sp. VAP52]|uniref:Rha family transcriptional regulator n=1 Tax=Clostridium sp. VAP52 TaxID=2949977 RepID=UPI002079C265|nr:Rha family transcriptional regulator [Clostridium sp. VAP52]
MERNKIELLLGEFQFNEMLLTQVISWELILQKKKYAQTTIDRKIKNIMDFFVHMNKIRLYNKNKRIKMADMNKIAFEFVRDGYFNEDNIENEGTKNYRENIYYNIMTGINYIYQDYFKNTNEIIKPLSKYQKEILLDVSKNKWFKVCSVTSEDLNLNDNLQIELIKQLGIKVYFDDKDKPYVLSHELAELIGKENSKIMRDVDNLLNKIGEAKIGESSEYVDFTKVYDTYVNSQNKEQPTYKLYKDLLLMYVLGLTGQAIVKFKVKYISAFNYIEQEYNKLLIESFLDMYNEIRKRNRDLLITDFNKKCKRTAS